jgi:hypothetical protein
VTPSAPSSTTGAVHDRHRQPGDDAHTPRDEFELLLRIRAVDEAQLVVITFWASLDAVRAFAGDDHKVGVVPPPRDGCSRDSTNDRGNTRRSSKRTSKLSLRRETGVSVGRACCGTMQRGEKAEGGPTRFLHAR